MAGIISGGGPAAVPGMLLQALHRRRVFKRQPGRAASPAGWRGKVCRGRRTATHHLQLLHLSIPPLDALQGRHGLAQLRVLRTHLLISFADLQDTRQEGRGKWRSMKAPSTPLLMGAPAGSVVCMHEHCAWHRQQSEAGGGQLAWKGTTAGVRTVATVSSICRIFILDSDSEKAICGGAGRQQERGGKERTAHSLGSRHAAK